MKPPRRCSFELMYDFNNNPSRTISWPDKICRIATFGRRCWDTRLCDVLLSLGIYRFMLHFCKGAFAWTRIV